MLYIERRGVHEVEHWARDAQLRNYLFMRGHQKQLCVASPVLHFVDTSAFYTSSFWYVLEMEIPSKLLINWLIKLLIDLLIDQLIN